MKKESLTGWLSCLIAVAGSGIGFAGPQPLPASQLTKLTFDQKLGTQVDLSLLFKDEKGQAVKLGDYFGRKPVILDLGYYECPMLCTLVLNGLVQGLQGMQPTIGKDFEVVCVLRLYDRAGAESGWHFLTGNAPAIKALADAVGFHYAFDPSVRQYAHPSGLVILTPEGKVARYFFGVKFASGDLQTVLSRAAAKKVGSPVQQLLILCCSFLPLIGKYSGTILLLVRVAGGLVVLALAGLIVHAFWREPKRGGSLEPAQAERKP
jgi:protein SCO1